MKNKNKKSLSEKAMICGPDYAYNPDLKSFASSVRSVVVVPFLPETRGDEGRSLPLRSSPGSQSTRMLIK
jgi:hypothetical protein